MIAQLKRIEFTGLVEMTELEMRVIQHLVSYTTEVAGMSPEEVHAKITHEFSPDTLRKVFDETRNKLDLVLRDIDGIRGTKLPAR
jgi:hypothetical protein